MSMATVHTSGPLLMMQDLTHFLVNTLMLCDLGNLATPINNSARKTALLKY